MDDTLLEGEQFFLDCSDQGVVMLVRKNHARPYVKGIKERVEIGRAHV